MDKVELRGSGDAVDNRVARSRPRRLRRKSQHDPSALGRVRAAEWILSALLHIEREAILDKIRLALVGCGGMGTRHLYGLGELAKTPFDNVDLVAVCDIRRDNAELAAAEAEKLVGQRPAVFTDLETMHREVADLMAVDVVVDPSVHHARDSASPPSDRVSRTRNRCLLRLLFPVSTSPSKTA